MTANVESRTTTLISTYWPNEQGVGWIRGIFFAFLGSLLLTVCAKIQVQVGLVPITMQTFAVLLIGAVYGWRLGGITLILYLSQGMMGAPVFAGPAAGPTYFMGPTAGFLLGLLLAAVVVGFLSERGWDRNPITLTCSLLMGNAVIYIPGLIWLQTFTGWDRVLQAGFLPFLPGDILKLTSVLLLCFLAKQRANKYL